MKPQSNAKAKPGPGLLRMKAKLGPAKTEALRQATLRDQANATSAAKPPASEPKPQEPKPAKASAPPDAGAKIKLLVSANPHRTGSKDRAKFALVAANLTVGAALAAGIDRGYLNYAAKRKLVEIG